MHRKNNSSIEYRFRKTRLYDYVKHFQNTDDSYLLIKETIKREISFILKDPKQLLKIALLSLIESSRKDPRVFMLCVITRITLQQHQQVIRRQ